MFGVIWVEGLEVGGLVVVGSVALRFTCYLWMDGLRGILNNCYEYVSRQKMLEESHGLADRRTKSLKVRNSQQHLQLKSSSTVGCQIDFNFA